MNRIAMLLFILGAAAGCSADRGRSGPPQAVAAASPTPAAEGSPMHDERERSGGDKVDLTDEQWRKKLDPSAYQVLRHAGTERAFTGRYWDNHERGVYRCAGCGNLLFRSDAKYDSGTGWPSFWQPADKAGSVDTRVDDNLFVSRTEVLCHRCGGHLGHVFDDGPEPTGLRYCMNSAALAFEPDPIGSK